MTGPLPAVLWFTTTIMPWVCVAFGVACTTSTFLAVAGVRRYQFPYHTPRDSGVVWAFAAFVLYALAWAFSAARPAGYAISAPAFPRDFAAVADAAAWFVAYLFAAAFLLGGILTFFLYLFVDMEPVEPRARLWVLVRFVVSGGLMWLFFHHHVFIREWLTP